MSGIDWSAIESAATEQIISAVRAVRERHPDESIYGAMFHEFYGDGSVIYWPMVTVGTEESLAQAAAEYGAGEGGEDSLKSSLRWSGPDLVHGFDPLNSEQALADGVHAAASSSGEFEKWERLYVRFMRCFPKAAKLARKQLVAENLVGKQFIAIAEDEAGELVPLSLTTAQLLRNFPQYDVAEQERRRLAALPVEQRVLELLPSAFAARHEGPLAGEYEGLMVECGAAALPALARVSRGEEYLGGGVAAARMLAEINISTPEVVEALDGLMRREDADINARSWAASALARMDCSELILARAAELPAEVVTRGISGPFRGFRDRGAHRPLDYGPLDAVLRAHPHLESRFEKELKPGVGYCALNPDEVPAARAALDSSWNVIRTHARIVLENAGVRQ